MSIDAAVNNSYKHSLIQTLRPNFDSFKNAVPKKDSADEGAVKIITRDYFPSSGKLTADDFYLKVRDECVAKKAQAELQGRRCSDTIEDMVRHELQLRENLRKEVRNFAVTAIHAHYHDTFHAIWDRVRDALHTDDAGIKKNSLIRSRR